MVSYTKNELASATEISKQFGEYERMTEAMELLEDLSIDEEIHQRLNKNNKLLDGDDVLKKHGLSLDV